MAALLELEVQYAAGSHSDYQPERERIERWVRLALDGRREAAQLVVRIVDEDEVRELNERYRHSRGPTNVLSFPFDRPELLEPPLLGDVVVCAAVVAREAAAHNKQVEAHWAHLVIHGVLHLLGFDHQRQRDAVIMERLEKELLSSLGYEDPYESRQAQS